MKSISLGHILAHMQVIWKKEGTNGRSYGKERNKKVAERSKRAQWRVKEPSTKDEKERAGAREKRSRSRPVEQDPRTWNVVNFMHASKLLVRVVLRALCALSTSSVCPFKLSARFSSEHTTNIPENSWNLIFFPLFCCCSLHYSSMDLRLR